MSTIGITFFVRKNASSIWSCGADQNCVFLVQLLRAAGHRVFAINGGDGEAPHPAMMMGDLGLEWARLPDVIDQIDVLIEAGAQVSAEHVARVRSRGGVAIAYRFGNAYVIDLERIIHGHPSGSIFNGARFDEVWTHAQHVNTCASYWETCYRCPVRVVPHIWEPTFVDAAIRELPEGEAFGYRPGRARKRVSVFEPNMNIIKTSVLPMLVCEQAYRRAPHLLGAVHVTNGLALKEHETFRHFAANLDIVRARGADGLTLCSLEARFNAPMFLSRYTDVVVSHQWENGLNYAYYDALYGGYPLVHNSDLLPVGYRYRGFDAADGGRALVDVLMHHDERADDYCRETAAYLKTVRATAPANIDAHQQALADLMPRAAQAA